MYHRGFVFGKYHPFHKGHQALIEFALKQCEELYVVVCESDMEHISGELRQAWVTESFQSNDQVKVVLLSYHEAELPNTSISSHQVSMLWAKRFQEVLPAMDVVFTSEPYGDYLAGFMGIEHQSFDPQRILVPISASQISKDPGKYWSYLPDAVKPYYCKKVVLLGTESTGKTTLAQLLALKFDATLVSETGRELIPNSKTFSMEHLYKVVEAHSQKIVDASKGAKPLVIIDTDLHITNSYSLFTFGRELDLSVDEYQKMKADLYLYLNLDVPHVQDGTRLSKRQRDLLDQSHRNILAKYKVSMMELSGSWEQRNLTAIQAVNTLLKTVNDL